MKKIIAAVIVAPFLQHPFMPVNSQEHKQQCLRKSLEK